MVPLAFWTTNEDGTVVVGRPLIMVVQVVPDWGYAYSSDTQVRINGKTVSYVNVQSGYIAVTQEFAADHAWDKGVVTKEATTTETGLKTCTCTACGVTKEFVIPKMPASEALSPGAPAAAADEVITGMTSDTDPAGSAFGKVRLKSIKQTKTSVTVNWSKVSGAKKYVIYGNKCGRKNKPKKLAAVTGSSKRFTKVAGKKVKKGTYYKFIVVALDKNNCVVSASKLIHATTKGGKRGNHKSVTVKKAVLTKAKKLKRGKTLKLAARAVPASKKLRVSKHVAVRYESTNKKIATVSKAGKVKGVKKGTCYVYAFAQNGVYKKVKVVVK